MFKHTVLFAALFAPMCSFAAEVDAASAAPLSDIIVTANPLGSELFGLAQAASALDGRALLLEKRSTLGETLSDLPGMSATYYGPHVSRPVIRGMDADRIRILQNGSGTLDASALSFDHAVALDPIVAERIEVVRGPAALMYGGNAIGGVVNVIDNRIPQEALQGIQGAFESRYSSAEHASSSGAKLEAGNGRVAVHADAYTRDSGNLDIPGAAVSPRLRQLVNAGQREVAQSLLDAQGRLPNSRAKSSGGALGATAFFAQGSLGVSYSTMDSNYGTVAEPDIHIDLNSTRWDVAGEMHDLDGWIQSLKFKSTQSNYQHTEFEDGDVGTVFRSAGNETRIEAVHQPLNGLTGSFGMQFNRSDFSATGEEAFVPSTRTHAQAVFLYESYRIGDLTLNAGGRLERTVVRSEGGGAVAFGDTQPRFGTVRERIFNATSTSVGGVYNMTPALALAVNLAASERAPTFYELFAHGPHAATGMYEIGNPDFDLERSRSIDLNLRMRQGPHSASIGVFYTRFDRFITQFYTGNTRGADGEFNPPPFDGESLNTGEAILPEVAYRQVPAVFQGVEAHGRFRLVEGVSNLDIELRGDYTKAYDRTTRQPLPRIAPLRLGGSLIYSQGGLNARLGLTRVMGQTRVATNELPTDAYTLVSASASYPIKAGAVNWETFVRLNNLLNVEARNPVSFLKDIAPLPARSVTIGVRAVF